MSENEDRAYFNTLRGALSGVESDEPLYFAYSATLRIHGEDLPFEEIENTLNLFATNKHRKGEKRGPKSPGYRDDAWHFRPQLPENEFLYKHIDELWRLLKPHVEFLKALKLKYKVDIFCGYRSNHDHAGVEIPHSSLDIFKALEIPLGISIIVA